MAGPFCRWRTTSGGWHSKAAADFRAAAAAVFGEEPHKIAHRRNREPVANKPPLPASTDETRPLQLLNVERQALRRDANAFGKLTGCLPSFTNRHQPTKDRQPMFLGERCKRAYGDVIVHISTIQELSKYKKSKRETVRKEKFVWWTFDVVMKMRAGSVEIETIELPAKA